MILLKRFQTILVLCTLATVVGAASSLRAQDGAALNVNGVRPLPVTPTPTVTLDVTDLKIVGTFYPIGTLSTSYRIYTGTATQTTAAGVASTAPIRVYVTLGTGLVNAYASGTVAANFAGRVASIEGAVQDTGSGYLRQAGTTLVNMDATGDATAIKAKRGAKIPIIVQPDAVYGGAVNADGSSFLFRATTN